MSNAVKLTEAEKAYIIRIVGYEAEKGYEGERGTEEEFAFHLAAHSVIEEKLTGNCTKTLNTMAPCPYCGKLPPGMVLPHSDEVGLA